VTGILHEEERSREHSSSHSRSFAKSGHKRLAHCVGAILVTAHRETAPSRAKTSFAPTCCLGQCPNVVWFDLAFSFRFSVFFAFFSGQQRQRRLLAVPNPELIENMRKVVLDRLFADVKASANFFIAQPL